MLGSDCRFTPTCTIYDVDPSIAEPSSSIFGGANAQPLDRSVASFVDGIAFDPSGNFLLLSTRAHWNGDGSYVNFFALTILNRAGVVVQQVLNDTCGNGCTHEPDGIAFHAGSPGFVVTDNTDGTMTRFEFPSNDFTSPPAVTLFASGGHRGDLSQVGPDGCLYISQDLSNVEGDVSDIAQICGGFAQPTGSSQSVTLTFSPGNTTQVAMAGTGNDAQSLALTLTSVMTTFNVTVTFFFMSRLTSQLGQRASVFPTEIANSARPTRKMLIVNSLFSPARRWGTVIESFRTSSPLTTTWACGSGSKPQRYPTYSIPARYTGIMLGTRIPQIPYS